MTHDPLHGIPAADDEAPTTHRPGEYLGIPRERAASGWIGVDLDGTLSVEDRDWTTAELRIGPPIPKMVERVKGWLADGKRVKIFTARVGLGNNVDDQMALIAVWCKAHLGQVLEVTCAKDYAMLELWDDRCVQMQTNTGQTIVEHIGLLSGVVARQTMAGPPAQSSPTAADAPPEAPPQTKSAGARRMGPSGRSGSPDHF